jgi:hypothetical protein
MDEFFSGLFVPIGTSAQKEYGFLAWEDNQFVVYVPSVVNTIKIYNFHWLLQSTLSECEETRIFCYVGW